MATHNNSGRVRQSVYIWVEQVWPIGPWELPRSSCSTSSSCPKKQENSKCACSMPHCSFFYVLLFFCSIWSLSDINHMKKEQNASSQTVCKLWASIVSVTRLTDASGTLLQFGQVGVSNTEDQNYPQIVKGLADQVTFKTILSGCHLVLR